MRFFSIPSPFISFQPSHIPARWCLSSVNSGRSLLCWCPLFRELFKTKLSSIEERSWKAIICHDQEHEEWEWGWDGLFYSRQEAQLDHEFERGICLRCLAHVCVKGINLISIANNISSLWTLIGRWCCCYPIYAWSSEGLCCTSLSAKDFQFAPNNRSSTWIIII